MAFWIGYGRSGDSNKKKKVYFTQSVLITGSVEAVFLQIRRQVLAGQARQA